MGKTVKISGGLAECPWSPVNQSSASPWILSYKCVTVVVKAEEMLMSHVWGTWGTTGNFHILQSPTKLPGVRENSIGNFIALPRTLLCLPPSAGCESGSVYFPCSCPPTSGWWWFSARFARSMWAALLLLLYCPSQCPLVFTHVIPSGHVPFFFCGVGVIGRCLNENFVGGLFFPIHQFSDYLHGDSLLIINSWPIAQAYY